MNPTRLVSVRLAAIGAILLFTLSPTSGQQAPAAFNASKYHSHADVTAFLRQAEKAHPKLVRVESIGKSYKGLDLWVATVTNLDSGAPESKPAIFMDGNIDGDEPIATEVTLHTINTLLAGYGKDGRITRLLDTRTFYIFPVINPDMTDLFVTTNTPDVVSSRTAKPFDDDGDGKLDEDGPEDINGDGLILQMRRRDINGGYKTSPTDPRLIVVRGKDEPGEWRVWDYEGNDNDGDGLINEDPIGGNDPNRNFPTGWQPEAIQAGAGPYPLSEIESLSFARFVLQHPNIGIYLNGHTGGGTGHLYRPYGSKTDDQLIKWDLTAYDVLGHKAQELMPGVKYYAPSGAVALRRFGRPIHGYGYMMEWAYDDQGILSMVPEHGGSEGDANNDREITQEEKMKVNDEKYGGKLFVNWTKVQHPTLGEVEVGGWMKFGLATNPPAERLPAIMPPWTEWNLYLASMLPHLSIASLKADAIQSGVYRVTAVVENDGYLPTNVSERSRVVRKDWPVKVQLQAGGGAEVLLPRGETTLGDLQGLGFWTPLTTSGSLDYWGTDNSRTMEWIVRTAKPGPTWVQIEASSPRAGTARKRLDLMPASTPAR